MQEPDRATTATETDPHSKGRQQNLQISAKSENLNLKTKAGRKKPPAADSEFYSFTKVTTGRQ